MSTIQEIEEAVLILGIENLLIAQATSTYPCSVEELNLQVIQIYKEIFPDVPIGYSGHETGLAPTLAAVALGARFVERHITLDRAMWGTDQAASVEISGMQKLVHDIRDIEKALGDGIKRVYESEYKSIEKLRRVKSNITI
jgi:N-acetylneuraminate synthase